MGVKMLAMWEHFVPSLLPYPNPHQLAGSTSVVPSQWQARSGVLLTKIFQMLADTSIASPARMARALDTDNLLPWQRHLGSMSCSTPYPTTASRWARLSRARPARVLVLKPCPRTLPTSWQVARRSPSGCRGQCLLSRCLPRALPQQPVCPALSDPPENRRTSDTSRRDAHKQTHLINTGRSSPVTAVTYTSAAMPAVRPALAPASRYAYPWRRPRQALWPPPNKKSRAVEGAKRW